MALPRAASNGSIVRATRSVMSFNSSERNASIIITGGSPQALIGLKVGDHDEPEPEHGPAEAPPLSRFTLVMILVVYMYSDSSVSLWNQLYKESRLGLEDAECEPLRRKFCEDHITRGAAAEWLEENERCAPYVLGGSLASPTFAELLEARRLESSEVVQLLRLADNTSVAPAVTAAPTAAPSPPSESTTVDDLDLDRDETEQARGCSWKITRSLDSGAWRAWRRRPQTYTKGAALGVQAGCGLCVFWAFNYWAGGMDQLKMCFDVPRLLRFGIVGCAFGLSAVFSFYAQDALPPGSYALYAQSGIIVVPILWRVVFNTPLNYLTWVHICLIGMGIVMYRVSEMGGGDNEYDGVGLFWVGLKVMTTSAATVFAELFLKGDPDVPFSVQCSYILPWKMLTTFSTILLLPPHHLPDRPGGIFHDWNFLTVVIITHNLGDTIGSAIVAKLFDSVVKAVCGVLSIIVPTWVVSYLAGWETIAWATADGQLKFSGAVIVVFGSLAYTLGRNMTATGDAMAAQLRKLEDRQVKDYPSPLRKSGGAETPSIEMPLRAQQDPLKVSTVYEDEAKHV